MCFMRVLGDTRAPFCINYIFLPPDDYAAHGRRGAREYFMYSLYDGDPISGRRRPSEPVGQATTSPTRRLFVGLGLRSAAAMYWSGPLCR